MQIISDDSIELEEIPSDSESEQVTRKSYRLQVKHKKQFFLKIDECCFPLVDISDSGICISVQADTEFPQDAILKSCELILGDRSFDNLEGEIVHMSVDGDGNWISGIKWTLIDEKTHPDLEELLAHLRREFFENV
jgi:hypothetical protein